MNADDNREAQIKAVGAILDDYYLPDADTCAAYLIANRDAVLRALGKDTSLNCDECMADYGQGFEDGKASMTEERDHWREEALSAEREGFGNGVAWASGSDPDQVHDCAGFAWKSRAEAAERKVALVEAVLAIHPDDMWIHRFDLAAALADEEVDHG